MISWLQTNLQKHFRVLFIVLLGVVIVAFVFTIGAAPGIGNADQARLAGLKFYDTELDTEAKREAFFGKASLSAYIQMGGSRMPQSSMEQYAFARATALYLANQHSIPHPSKEQLSEFVQTLAIFKNPDGAFDPQRYNDFLDQVSAAAGQSANSIAQTLAEEYRIEKVYNALSGPGFALQEEVLDALRQEQASWSILVAELDLASYQPEIDDSEEALLAFYESRKESYARPPRRLVSYLSFNASEYQADANPSESELLAHFEANKSSYASSPEQEATLELDAVRESVRLDLKLEQAKLEARQAAQDLVLDLIENDTAYKSEPFDALLADIGKELASLPPFAQTETPIGTGWSKEVSQAAFSLSATRYYSEPLAQGDSVLVLFYDSEIGQSIPQLEEIRDQVARDYASEEKRRLQYEYGVELKEMLSERSNATSFTTLSESKGLSVSSYDGFTISASPEGLDRSLLYSLNSMRTGDVSDMIIRGGKGFFLNVSERFIPEIAPEGEAYDAGFDSMKNVYKRFVGSQYISELTEKELQRIQAGSSNG